VTPCRTAANTGSLTTQTVETNEFSQTTEPQRPRSNGPPPQDGAYPACSGYHHCLRFSNLADALEFVSSALILDQPSRTYPEGNRSPDLQLNQIRQQATDRAAIIALIDRDDPSCQARDNGINQEAIISDVRTRIGVDFVAARDEGAVFRVSFRSPDPETAKRVAADLADQIISKGARSDTAYASKEVEALRKRTDDLALKLRELERIGPGLSGFKEPVQSYRDAFLSAFGRCVTHPADERRESEGSEIQARAADCGFR
jgi:hypothetical protein